MKTEEDQFGPVLDAYGHMSWVVCMKPSKDGGDWLACFDARRVPNGIEYQVVVNSDSASFFDTMEHTTVAVKEAESLFSLPEYWWEIGLTNGPMYSPRNCAASWRKHIRKLVKEAV